MKQSKRTQQFKRLLVQNKVSIALRKIHEWLQAFDKNNYLAALRSQPTTSTVELDRAPELAVALQRCRAAGISETQLYNTRIARFFNSRAVRGERHFQEAEDRRNAYTPSLPELLPVEAVSEHMTDLYARKAKAAETGQFTTREVQTGKLRDLLVGDSVLPDEIVGAGDGWARLPLNSSAADNDETWFLEPAPVNSEDNHETPTPDPQTT